MNTIGANREGERYVELTYHYGNDGVIQLNGFPHNMIVVKYTEDQMNQIDQYCEDYNINVKDYLEESICASIELGDHYPIRITLDYYDCSSFNVGHNAVINN